MEVGHYAPELAVDEVERTAEVLGAYAHKCLHYIHFRFASATGDNLAVQMCDEFPVSIIRAVEIVDDSVSIHAKGREDERSAISCGRKKAGKAVKETPDKIERLHKKSPLRKTGTGCILICCNG